MTFDLKKEIRLNKVKDLGNGLTRIIADNPGPMTYKGTCTYLLGHDSIAIIDPGPNSSEHLKLILKKLNGRKVSNIILTHSHLDHSGLAKKLSYVTNAPIFLFGSNNNYRSSTMRKLFKSAELPTYKNFFRGAELKFLRDGEQLKGNDWTLEVVYTPGHFYDHICLSWIEQTVLFSGDHVMGWSSTLIAPPDGDMKDFMESLKKLSLRPEKIYFPGHGPVMINGSDFVSQQISHRVNREKEILKELLIADYSALELASKIYENLESSLYQAGVQTIFAHLIDLYMRKIISCEKQVSINSRFKLKYYNET